MSELTRRSFLRGALTLTALAVVPVTLTAAYPAIVGDGIHDDTAGLQAALDGKPFVCEGHAIEKSKHLRLTGGDYRITKPLIVRRDGIHIDGGTFYADDGARFEFVDGVKECGISNVTVVGNLARNQDSALFVFANQ